MSFRISYSQNREDCIIDTFFPEVKKGFYVDIGANDPDEDSVTKLFYQKGWRGVNIEPLQSKHALLVKKRPRDINLNLGISDSNSTVQFREYEGHGLSTFSEDIKVEHEGNINSNVDTYTDYPVEVKTLVDVLDEIKPEHIHFMKIDVEGLEYEVIKGGDWINFRPELICIEANHVVHEWRALLEQADYRCVFFDGLNEYYLAKESAEREKVFRKMYPEKNLAGAQIIKWTVRAEFDMILNSVKSSESHLKDELRKLHTELDKVADDRDKTLRALARIARPIPALFNFIKSPLRILRRLLTIQ